MPLARLLNAATVEKKKCWCPNPAWRQVRAKTGVLARKRRIFAVWSPRWARALCLRKLQVVSPRRNVGTHRGYSTNWFPPLSPLPLRSRKIQWSGSERRNQWNTGDGNTARPAGRDSKREAGPIRFHPRHCTQRPNTRHKRLLRSRCSAPGKAWQVRANLTCSRPHPPTCARRVQVGNQAVSLWTVAALSKRACGTFVA